MTPPKVKREYGALATGDRPPDEPPWRWDGGRAAIHQPYEGGRGQLERPLRLALSLVVDIRDPIQRARDRIAARAELVDMSISKSVADAEKFDWRSALRLPRDGKCKAPRHLLQPGDVRRRDRLGDICPQSTPQLTQGLDTVRCLISDGCSSVVGETTRRGSYDPRRGGEMPLGSGGGNDATRRFRCAV